MEFFVSATVNWSHALNAVSFSRNGYAKTTRSSFIETCPNLDNRFMFFFLGKTLVSWDPILRIWTIVRRSQLVCHSRTFHLCGAYNLKQTSASEELCSEFGKQSAIGLFVLAISISLENAYLLPSTEKILPFSSRCIPHRPMDQSRLKRDLVSG